jgi:very-short-patch-repair endonuclease
MRASLNATEALVWTRLRRRGLDGWKFRRQHPIGPYFVDFFCPAARLVVEIDGPTHYVDDAKVAYDRRRDAWLEAEGYAVHHIGVAEISRDLGDVIDGIYAALDERERLGFARRPAQR